MTSVSNIEVRLADRDATAGAHHACQLVQCPARVVEVVEDTVGAGGLEGGIGERQAPDIPHLKVYRQIQPGAARTCFGGHGRAQVDPRDVASRSHELGERPNIVSGPTPDIQNPSGGGKS